MLRTFCHSHESGNLPVFQVIVDSRLHGNDANLMALRDWGVVDNDLLLKHSTLN